MSTGTTSVFSEAEQMWQPVDREGQFRSFFDRSGMCVASLDSATRVIEANADLVRQFGRSEKDVRGRLFCDLLHPSVRDKVGEQFGRLTARQRFRFDEGIVVARPDSTVFSGDITGIAVRGDAGNVENIMVLVRPDQGQRAENVLARRKHVFTDMETRVLEGVAAGMSTVQLAQGLFLSRGGIEYHVTMLLRKLKVNNRPALVSKAYSMGIFRVGSWPPRVLPDYCK